MSCVSGGMSSSSGTTNVNNMPAWSVPFFESFAPKGVAAVNQYDPSGGAEKTASTDLVNNTLNGIFSAAPTPGAFDPVNNPALSKAVGATELAGQQSFANALAQIQGGAQSAGMLDSSGAQAAAGQAARQSAADVTGQVAGLENTAYTQAQNIAEQNYAQQEANKQADYSQQLGLQSGAVNQAQSQENQALNQALAIGSQLKGLSTVTDSQQTTGNVSMGI